MTTLSSFLDEWNNNLDYIVAHTSGSTGKPKEIRLLKSDMAKSAIATNKRFSISSESVLAIPLSLDYIAGKMMVVRALMAKCQIKVIEPSNHFYIPDYVDLISVVPSQALWLLANPNSAQNLRTIIIGGGALNREIQESLSQHGFNAYMSYGMTETCSHVALQKITGKSSYFTAMPGISFEIDDRHCLIINAPEFSFQRLVTNDVVDLIDNTTFSWKGRIDNVINSGGIKMQAEELEMELSPFLDTPFFIRSFPHYVWGEAIELVVVKGEKNEDEIGEILYKNLPGEKRPKKITLVDALPLTANGKLKRK